MINEIKGLKRTARVEDARDLELWGSLVEAAKSQNNMRYTKQKLYLIIRENNITVSFGGRALLFYIHSNQQHHFNRHTCTYARADRRYSISITEH